MGKCARIRTSSCGKHQPSPGEAAAAAAACLTLRSGRRVPPVAAACSPRAGTPRRHRGSRRCGAEAADKRACGGGLRRSSSSSSARPSPRGGRVLGAGHEQLCCDDDGRRLGEQQLPSQASSPAARDVVDGCTGGSLFEPKTPLMVTAADSDGEVGETAEARHENESRKGVLAGQPSPPPEAEMEAFFAAAELAERRRFAEAYNYDVALDRPLEGRFEWAPMST